MHDTLIKWTMAIHDLEQIERILHKHGITAQTISQHTPDESEEEGVIFEHQSTKSDFTLNWRLSVQTSDRGLPLQYVRVQVRLSKQGSDDNCFHWMIEHNYRDSHWRVCPSGEAELSPLNPEIDKELSEMQDIYRQDFGCWEFDRDPVCAMVIIISFARIFAAAT